MKNISPNSNDRLRVAMKKCLDTFDQLIKTVKCPQTKRVLEAKAQVARTKANALRGEA